MRNYRISPKPNEATITIRVSGKLFEGHLSYLDHLISSAADCQLWPLLSLSDLRELDRAAVLYLLRGEHSRFALVSCPSFVREWMDRERHPAAA
jgi:hypothetical protein